MDVARWADIERKRLSLADLLDGVDARAVGGAIVVCRLPAAGSVTSPRTSR